MTEEYCEDCLAHYTGEHTCPPWLKVLKKLKDQTETPNGE
jgi:hypothetical protein